MIIYGHIFLYKFRINFTIEWELVITQIPSLDISKIYPATHECGLFKMFSSLDVSVVFLGPINTIFTCPFFSMRIFPIFIIFLLSFRFACGDNKQVLQGERLARLTSLKKEHEEYERKRREREKDSNQPRQPTKRFTGVCHNCGKTGHRQSACKEAKKKE